MNKLCHHRLIQTGYWTVIIPAALLKPFHKPVRQYHISHPERRCDGFGEGADINDVPSGINALQRRDWSPLIAVFAVVVVFDDISLLFFLCPQKKLLSSGDGHNRSQWKLV